MQRFVNVSLWGCQVVDEVEELARERAKKAFEQNMPMYNHIQDHKQIWQCTLQYFNQVIQY